MTKLLVTVDVVLFTIRDRKLHLLLIKRLAKPFENRYALPGGFVREDESLDAAAIRELREETGVATSISNSYIPSVIPSAIPGDALSP
jgi:8-oxo-dGTP diphosphatase